MNQQRGQIMGQFSTGDSARGFLDGSGHFMIISVSGSAAMQTFGINNAGQIVGADTDSTGKQHALLDSDGSSQKSMRPTE